MPILKVALISAQLQDKGHPPRRHHERKRQDKNSAFTRFKYVTEGRYNRDEKSPIIGARDACTAACVRSERGACTAEGVSAAMEVVGTVECAECCVVRNN